MARSDARHVMRTPASALRHVASVAETIAALLGAQALVALVPMRVWRRWFEIGAVGERAGGQTDGVLARGIGLGRQVERVAESFPWTVKCLPRALAASAILSRRGIRSQLAIGARRDTGPVELHAWLTLSGTCIVGREERKTYHAFVPAKQAARDEDTAI